MTGTDASSHFPLGGPAIVLVEPQLGENIGSAARAMLNCGLLDLRLVRPREPWPNHKAVAAASGADRILEEARCFDDTSDAVADLLRIYATTARARDMVKPTLTPRQAMAEIRAELPDGRGCGILFGPERTGLGNDDVALAHALISAPLNPAASSLNLAHAVLLVAYEWLQAVRGEPRGPIPHHRSSRLATGAELASLLSHLETGLEATGFLRPAEKRAMMVRNLRNIFTRAGLTEQEVRTLHGVVTSLSGRRLKEKA
jgi:tRNA/rRNA methyltransferase